MGFFIFLTLLIISTTSYISYSILRNNLIIIMNKKYSTIL